MAAIAASANADVAFVSGNSLKIDRDGEALLSFDPVYWGDNWGWRGFGTKVENVEGASVINSSTMSDGAKVSFDIRIAADGKRKLNASWELGTDKDTKSTLGIVSVNPGKLAARTVVTSADGTSREIVGGYGRNPLGKSVSSLALFAQDGGKPFATISFKQPVEVGADGAARVVLAAGEFSAASAPRRAEAVIELDQDVTFYASAADVPLVTEDWFEWKARGASEEKSALSMEDWLDKPAGRLGRVTGKDDKLLYGGKPIRLWGLNVCYSACSPQKDMAEKRAKFYARYGVNAVRFHKYADGRGWAGIQGVDSFADFDAEGLDRMDYFIAQLKEQGIYTKFSAHFGTPSLGKGDLKAVPYLEEFGKFGDKPDARVQVPASGTYYSPEVQNVQIAHYVNLLKHRNPYTGLTYAEDPAIAFIEILNEQSIMFYTSMAPLKASETLRKNVGKRFGDWLRAKYGDHDGLLAAWGAQALNSFGAEGFASSGERLDADNILPIGNPWFWDPDQVNGSQKFRRQRLLDSMTFLTLLQDEFNARFVAAMREAGYAGEIVGSNWQAGRAYSHLMNLHSDALVGTVDRHNYFGGVSRTMLDSPGSGLLSSGLQQVARRPFMLSEWIHTFPSDYGVEGPAILGAYGMGLQGWDVSFMFQNSDNGAFLGALGDTWAVSAPQIMGVFPAVSRQVLRGDVDESALVATRYADVKSLSEGKLGFDDRVEQNYDFKEFSGTVTPAALAAARCVVEFADDYKETPPFDAKTASPLNTTADSVHSATKQLRWQTAATSGASHFTIDTPGTQAYIGFPAAPGAKRIAKLSLAEIEGDSNFSTIYITAAAPNATIDTADTLLITMLGRAYNTGMKTLGNTLIEKGKGPILIEPISAKIKLTRKHPTIWALDHDGVRTGEKVPVNQDGSFYLDGAKYKTPYYEVTF